MTRRARPPRPLVLLAAVLAGGSATAPAQWGPTAGSLHTSKVTVADDLGLDPLEVAARAAAAGDVERALTIYQDLLDRLPDLVWHAVVAPRTGAETERVLDGDRFFGLRDHVHALIRGLPKDGLAAYRAREGPKAARDLATAVAARDEAALRTLVRSRGLTPAGLEALGAAADLAFEDGRPLDAAVFAERLLVEAGDDVAQRRRAFLRGGLAYAVAGDSARLAALRARVGAEDDAAPVVVGGATRTVGAALDDLLARAPKPAPVESRPAPSFEARPWAPLGLRTQGVESRWDERFLSFGQYLDPGATYAPVVPLVTDSVVYVNDGLSADAISLFTGRRLWSVPGRFDDFQGRRNWNVSYECVLDRDLLFAYLEDEPQLRGNPSHSFQGFVPIETLATRKLYAIDARTGEIRWTHARFDGARTADDRAFLAKATITTPPLVLGDRLYVGACFYKGGFRHWLCCFDRATGAILWRTFVALGQAEQNMFGNAVKDCPPGYVGAHEGLLVYSTNVGAVAAVDAATGLPKWVTAYLQEPIPSVDGPGAIERGPGWAGARPIFFNGRAYVGPADATGFYSFDLKTGEAKVVRDRERNESAARNRDNRLRHVVGLFDGVLVLSGRELVAFDVSKLDAERGATLAWRTAPPGGGGERGGVDGRPAVLGDRIWFSTRLAATRGGGVKSRLFAVDVKTGRFVDERVVDGPFATGNLVFGEDAAVVAGGTPGNDAREGARLAAFFDVGRAASRLEAAIARSPDDPALRLRLGHLKLQSGDVAEAAAAFKKAEEAARAAGPAGAGAAASARQALYDVFLTLGSGALRAGPGLPSSAEERFDLARSYAATPRQRAVVLLARLAWAHQAGKAPQAIAAARDLLAEHADEDATFEPAFADLLKALEPGRPTKAGLLGALVAAATSERKGDLPAAVEFLGIVLRRFPEASLRLTTRESVDAWRYAYEAIDALVKNHGAEIYAREEAEARRRFAAAKDGGDPQSLRDVVDQYPNASTAPEARLLLIRRLRETGRTLEAFAAAQRELARFGAPTPEVVVEAVLAFEAAGAYESARDALASLKARFGERAVATVDGVAKSASAYAAERLADPAYAATEPPPPPATKLGTQTAWTETPDAEGGDAELVSPRGVRPPSARETALVATDGELRAIELATGRRRWRKPSDAPPLAPQWRDGRLIAVFGDDVASVDPATGTEIWRAVFEEGRPLALAAGHGKVYVLLRDGGARRGFVLRSLDAASGARLRDREFPSLGGDSEGPMEGVGLEVDPHHVLVRITAGTGAVLDGLTGAVVAQGFPRRSGVGVPPFLGPDGLVVLSIASVGMKPDEMKLVGRRPETQVDVWTWRAERVVRSSAYRVGPAALLLSIDRATNVANRTDREIVLLDLARGTTLLSKRLAPGEWVRSGVLSGDLLLLAMHKQSVFVRAYDVPKDALAWESVSAPGRNPVVQIYPAEDVVVVRFGVEATGAAQRLRFVRQDLVRLLERRTGKVLDEVPLTTDEVVQLRPDVELRGEGIVIESAAGVEFRR